MTDAIRERSRANLGGAREADAATPSTRAATGSGATKRSAPSYDRVADSPQYLQFLANVGKHAEAERPVRVSEAERTAAAAAGQAAVATQERLDSFRAHFSGPYEVDGQTVEARPMFRMNGGANEATGLAHEAALRAICAKAKVPDVAVGNARVGRPTPGQLRQVTQALIDAGKLPPGLDSSRETRIRQMQWTWGIGVDCAGYTEQAARAARGAKAERPTHGDAFTGLAHDPKMRKIDVARIRPGDVIHLDPPTARDVGHNVVVYDRHVASAAERARMSAAAGPKAAELFAGKGPFHVLEVDSSWGAGVDGGDHGGFRRDTWVYDEGSFTWGYFDGKSKAFHTSETGPHDEPYMGAFRPKGTP
ncbi:MAG: hypothetical protein KF764_00470 [Labilithrix sp.]|nr:hypothetical protein [Labilithrix sp.]